MSSTKDLEGLAPETDPVNRAPKTDRGYPVRLHARGGEVRYAENEEDRQFAILVYRHRLELHEWMNAPWWKRAWRRLKADF